MGVMPVFTWGDFGDQKDRIKGHPMSVDAVAKLDEDLVLTGCSDGKIRILTVYQSRIGNCIAGCLGKAGTDIDSLSVSPDTNLIASVAHLQPRIRIWSAESARNIVRNF